MRLPPIIGMQVLISLSNQYNCRYFAWSIKVAFTNHSLALYPIAGKSIKFPPAGVTDPPSNQVPSRRLGDESLGRSPQDGGIID